MFRSNFITEVRSEFRIYMPIRFNRPVDGFVEPWLGIEEGHLSSS